MFAWQENVGETYKILVTVLFNSTEQVVGQAFLPVYPDKNVWATNILPILV
jgi:hypothetical protein